MKKNAFGVRNLKKTIDNLRKIVYFLCDPDHIGWYSSTIRGQCWTVGLKGGMGTPPQKGGLWKQTEGFLQGVERLGDDNPFEAAMSIKNSRLGRPLFSEKACDRKEVK